MKNILDTIIAHKKKEVRAKKTLAPVNYLMRSPLYQDKTHSLAASVKNGSGIIAEFKRRSPSKAVINQKSSVAEVVSGYENAGVSGISILGDVRFFGGSIDDLIIARHEVNIPLLRKEFIIDPYQIYEARAYGADAILLIASVLSEEAIRKFAGLAHDLQLEVLLEVHNEEELNKVNCDAVDLIGVNNRDLTTFEVSLKTSETLARLIPDNVVKVSESGISSVDAITHLNQFGYRGFLIGENFMKTEDPGKAAVEFIKSLSSAKK